MDNQHSENILKALKTANNLMALVRNAEVLKNENIRGILLGVMQHCSYKIRRQAEHEAHKAKRKGGLPVGPILVICAVAVLSVVFASPVNGTTIILSTDFGETLGGLTFRDGDLAEYDPSTDSATLYFDEDLFTQNEDIDAVHVLDSGNIILSTALNATLGGLNFGDGDLIEYNPTTDTATLFLSENLFGVSTNVDAAYVRDNGNIILSTTSNATLGGLSFADGDLVEYNPATNTATLLFSESLFANDENIDAVHILDNGNIILSTNGAASLGGLSFADGDLVKYNHTTGVVSRYLDESLFSNNANIDAAYVASTPEPTTIALLGLGSLILIRRRRK